MKKSEKTLMKEKIAQLEAFAYLLSRILLFANIF